MKKAVALLLILVFLMTFVSVSFANSGNLTGLEKAYERADSRSQGKAPEVLAELLDRETDTKPLIVIKEGEGTLEINGKVVELPYTGEHEENSEVKLKAIANEGWEFYAWTGENVSDVAGVQEEETTITMDGEKQITAFFADKTLEKYDLEIQTKGFMGAEGTVEDLTGHPPYPPGFEILLKAVPNDPEKHIFTHWGLENPGTTVFQTENYFSNPESPLTRFRMLSFPFIIIAYFTTWGGPTDPLDFNYDHNDFGNVKSGFYGIHYDFWNISEVETGRSLDFYFQARNIPDRFKVYYGYENEWFEDGQHDFEMVFNSDWVSINPQNFINPALYQPDPKYHDWHPNVDFSNRITFNGESGGKYGSIIEKVEGKNVLMFEIEGRDHGTIWDYTIELGVEPPEMTKTFLSLPWDLVKDPDIKLQAGWIYHWEPFGTHYGIDYIKEGATPGRSNWEKFDILAAANGVAIHYRQPGNDRVLGDYVIIRHDEKNEKGEHYFTLYAHLDSVEDNIKLDLKKTTPYEQWVPVSRGAKIGVAGESGTKEGIHLHFEVFTKSFSDRPATNVDPYDIYKQYGHYPQPPDVITGSGQELLWRE